MVRDSWGGGGLGCLTSLMALFIPPLIYLYTYEYIHVYRIYIYLSVDIYECMSNVSVTCRFRQYVSSPYIS